MDKEIKLDEKRTITVVDEFVLPMPNGEKPTKYELLGFDGISFFGYEGRKFHRIRYLKDINGLVKAGQLGGWIEGYHNLAQDGMAVVLGEAHVWGNASVSENATVEGGARVSENAKVCGWAIVCGCGTVRGNAVIADTAQVKDNAYVGGAAKIHGIAEICGRAEVTGDAVLDCYEVGRIEIKIRSEADIEKMNYHLAIMNREIQNGWSKEEN